MTLYAIGCLLSLPCRHCVEPANSMPGGKASLVIGSRKNVSKLERNLFSRTFCRANSNRQKNGRGYPISSLRTCICVDPCVDFCLNKKTNAVSDYRCVQQETWWTQVWWLAMWLAGTLAGYWWAKSHWNSSKVSSILASEVVQADRSAVLWLVCLDSSAEERGRSVMWPFHSEDLVSDTKMWSIKPLTSPRTNEKHLFLWEPLALLFTFDMR